MTTLDIPPALSDADVALAVAVSSDGHHPKPVQAAVRVAGRAVLARYLGVRFRRVGLDLPGSGVAFDAMTDALANALDTDRLADLMTVLAAGAVAAELVGGSAGDDEPAVAASLAGARQSVEERIGRDYPFDAAGVARDFIRGRAIVLPMILAVATALELHDSLSCRVIERLTTTVLELEADNSGK